MAVRLGRAARTVGSAGTLLSTAGILLLTAGAGWAHPKLFADTPLDRAKAQAKAEKKLLIVDFTASWCGPCHKMDDETWTNPAVEKWFRDNAIAIQIDVDKDKAAAQALKITAMPTLVIFAPGSDGEFDRDTGFRTAPDLLKWMEAAKKGKTSSAMLNDEAAGIMGKGGQAEVEARYKLASRFLNTGKFEDATTQYVWLWKNIPKQYPPMLGVRASFMANDMERLVKKYPTARPQIAALRDATAKNKDKSDWIILNQVLGENAETVKWFDQARKNPAERAEIEKVAYLLQDLLASSDRLADVAVLYKDPLQHLRETFKVSEETKKLSSNYDPFPTEAALLYTCYLAAHKDDVADKIARETMKLQNTPAMRNRLVITALHAEQFRPSQLKWLDDLTPGKDPSFYIERGTIFAQVNQPQRSLNDFEKAIAAGMKSSSIYCARGNAQMGLNHDDLAMADFNLAINMDGRNAWPLISKSALLFRQKKFQEAYNVAAKSIEVDPRQYGGWCNRGKAAFKLGKYDEAVSDLTKGTESNSRQYKGESFYYRAAAYDKLGKKEQSKKDMDAANLLKFKAPADPA